jgi:hypothetical protein
MLSTGLHFASESTLPLALAFQRVEPRTGSQPPIGGTPSGSQSLGRNGVKSGMASSSIFSSISTATPLSPEISTSLSKLAGS